MCFGVLIRRFSLFLFLAGIYWDRLSPQKLNQIKVLQQLKARIEKETGRKLPSGPDEELPPTAKRNQRNQRNSAKGGGGGRNGKDVWRRKRDSEAPR